MEQYRKEFKKVLEKLDIIIINPDEVKIKVFQIGTAMPKFKKI